MPCFQTPLLFHSFLAISAKCVTCCVRFARSDDLINHAVLSSTPFETIRALDDISDTVGLAGGTSACIPDLCSLLPILRVS